MSQVENFTNYGKAFQSKTIVCLIKDKLFIQQILDILETKYFESESDRWIVDMIKSYFTKYKKVPTMDAIKVALSEIDNDIVVEFDLYKLTQNDWEILKILPEIIKDSGSIGSFQLGNLGIDIIQMNEYQKDLIKIKQ